MEINWGESINGQNYLAHLTVIGVAAFCAIWLGYGFQMGTLKSYPFPAREYLTACRRLLTALSKGTLPDDLVQQFINRD
jgi:hypothetical protein